jgi:hypothetical protein
MANQSKGKWSLLVVSDLFHTQKFKEYKFENTLFSFGDETFWDITYRNECFGQPGSFKDETYGDVRKSGYTVRGRLVAQGCNIRECIRLVPKTGATSGWLIRKCWLQTLFRTAVSHTPAHLSEPGYLSIHTLLSYYVYILLDLTDTNIIGVRVKPYPGGYTNRR